MFDKVERHDARIAPRRPRHDGRGANTGPGQNGRQVSFPEADFFLLDGSRRGEYRRILPPSPETSERESGRKPGHAQSRKREKPPRLGSGKGVSLVLAAVGSASRGLFSLLGAFGSAIGGGLGTLTSIAWARKPASSWENRERPKPSFQAASRSASAAAAGRSPISPLVFVGLGLLLFGILAVASGLLEPRFPLPEGGLARNIPSVQDDLLGFMTPELSTAVTETSLPPLPVSLATDTYTVARGDSLGSIAQRNHIDIDSLISINGITNAKTLTIGQVLKIPNIRGIVHIVTKGESLGSIASANKVSVASLADANNLRSGTIQPGQAIFVPGAHLASADLRRVFGELTIWPVHGIISSWFGYRPDPFTGVRSFHGGLDLAVPQGTPVKAAMDGRVADVSYNKMFGNYVIINHSGGLQTLYGHLSVQEVKIGQAISQGQVLGLSGNTGYSTAPHLHFGIYKGGVSVNPLKYLAGAGKP